jgi:hypothetical protein
LGFSLFPRHFPCRSSILVVWEPITIEAISIHSDHLAVRFPPTFTPGHCPSSSGPRLRPVARLSVEQGRRHGSELQDCRTYFPNFMPRPEASSNPSFNVCVSSFSSWWYLTALRSGDGMPFGRSMRQSWLSEAFRRLCAGSVWQSTKVQGDRKTGRDRERTLTGNERQEDRRSGKLSVR